MTTARATCQCCGKPLRHWTTRKALPEKVRTLAEAKRFVNQQIISVELDGSGVRYDDNGKLEKLPRKDRMIRAVNLWDGERYIGYPYNGKPGDDAIFCSTTCCIKFAAASWRGGYRIKRS